MEQQCSPDFTTETQEGFYRICAWNPHKEWVEEGLKAIASIQNRTITLTHSICYNHAQQMKEEMNKAKEPTPEQVGEVGRKIVSHSHRAELTLEQINAILNATFDMGVYDLTITQGLKKVVEGTAPSKEEVENIISKE